MTASIGIIILNWNRSRLLDICLNSVMSTMNDSVKDVCVIDNASTDDSKSIIESYGSRVTPLLMPENRGAEWINDVFYEMDTDYIYILANDKKLLDGWQDYAIRSFDAFGNLAQLALHAPAPLDDEVWITKPSEYKYKNGVGIYQAQGNTGLSSIIRKSAAIKATARFYNIKSDGPYKLPDDGRFSSDIQKNEFISAWSERYYCLNLGHTKDEMVSEWDYYKDNYESKSWLRVEGLISRIELHDQTAKPVRYSQLLMRGTIPECRSFSGEPASRVWSIFSGSCPGVEAIEFIHSFVRICKPSSTFFCRPSSGELLEAICKAHFLNDYGVVNYFEPDSHWSEKTKLDLTTKNKIEPKEYNEFLLPLDTDFIVLCGYIEDLDENEISAALLSIPKGVQHIILDNNYWAKFFIQHNFDLTEFDIVKIDCPNTLRILTRKDNFRRPVAKLT
jgi:glycosyltransferase involved in cell wall biosynthesis